MSDNSRIRGIFQAVFALIAIGIAVGIFAYFRSTKTEPEKQEITERSVIADVVSVHRGSYPAMIRANGTVSAARDVRLAPQISGRVSWVSDSLNRGRIVREGEELFRIDPTDYRLAVQQAEAQLESARSQLDVEKGRARVAEQEWQLFADTSDDQDAPENSNPSLAQREPQLRAAEVQVQSAEAQLNQARSNLRRTTVKAPFDAYVESRAIEEGAFASPQSPAAHLVGVEKFWVEVALKPELLTWMNFRDSTEDGGSRATVKYDLGRTTITRHGEVLRLLQSLGQQGRMARILVEIDDPLNLDDSESGSARADGDNADIPLLTGAFVDVVIDGPDLNDVIRVPRDAQRNADEVWVVGEDSRMDIRTVDPVWSDEQNIYVDAGSTLKDGDRLIVTSISSPVSGLKIDVREVRDAEEAASRESGNEEPAESARDESVQPSTGGE
jgi:RND family efflux transporter MFP subunit